MSAPTVHQRSLDSLDWPAVLAGLAQRASTARGREACLALEPLDEVAQARRALDEVAEMMALLESSSAPTLGDIADLRGPLQAARKGEILAPPELIDVAHTLDGLERLHRTLSEQDDTAPLLALKGEEVHPLPDLAAWLASSFDSRGELSAATYPQLTSLRTRKARMHARIREALDSLRAEARFSEALQDDFLAMRNDRYVVPVKSQARRQGLGIVHDASGSGQTVFVEPYEIIEANNDLKMADAEREREQRRILRSLTERVGLVAHDIAHSLHVAADLDLCLAKAALGRELGGVVPELVDQPVIALIQARHPVLALQGIDVVPNDLRLGQGYRAMVLSGPNTGGKTISLKTLGLAALMARCALPFPADPGSRIGWFDAVLTDIGDLQDVEGGLSTFSGHVLSLVDILEAVDSSEGAVLVLLDEIAVGTDPVQGAALGRALLEAFLGRGALLATTTHYPELKALSKVDDRFINARVEFDGRQGLPTYRLSLGDAGSSHALDVAHQLGLEPGIVQAARGFLAPTAAEVEELLSSLEAEHRAAAQDRQEAAEALRRAENELRKARRSGEALERSRRSLERDLRAEFEHEVQTYRDNVRASLRQIRSERSEEAVERARQRISEGAHAVREVWQGDEPLPSQRPVDWQEAQVGMTVRVGSVGKVGKLMTLPDARGRVTVSLDGLKVQARAQDLELADPPPTGNRRAARPRPKPRRKQPPRPRESGVEAAFRSPDNTLDLRGDRVDEALERVDQFLDQASLRGWRHAFLLHGHGTGALRDAVRSHLRASSYVRSAEPGARSQGGAGVTVVTLH